MDKIEAYKALVKSSFNIKEDIDVPVYMLVSENNLLEIENYITNNIPKYKKDIILIPVEESINVFDENFQLLFKNKDRLLESSIGNGKLIEYNY